MKINRIAAVYYSATGNTKRVILTLGKQLSRLLDAPLEEFDYTLPASRNKHYSFSSDDLVLFATPVYAGRVPNKMLSFVETGFSGNGALALPVVTFGNRSFDQGLIELKAILEKNGFSPVAAAAVATSHVFSDSISPGRPDEADWEKLNRFICDTAEKVQALTTPVPVLSLPGEGEELIYYTPLGIDGKPTMFLKTKPQTHAQLCDGCGICVAACPMAAIDEEDPLLVPGTCIKCQACVRICPTKAKYFDDANFLSHVRMLEENYTERKEPQVFV